VTKRDTTTDFTLFCWPLMGAVLTTLRNCSGTHRVASTTGSSCSERMAAGAARGNALWAANALDGDANPILGQRHGEVPRGIRLRPSDLGWCFAGPSSRKDLRRYAGREAMPAHISSSRHAPVTASHLTKRSRCGCPGRL